MVFCQPLYWTSLFTFYVYDWVVTRKETSKRVLPYLDFSSFFILDKNTDLYNEFKDRVKTMCYLSDFSYHSHPRTIFTARTIGIETDVIITNSEVEQVIQSDLIIGGIFSNPCTNNPDFYKEIKKKAPLLLNLTNWIGFLRQTALFPYNGNYRVFNIQIFEIDYPVGASGHVFKITLVNETDRTYKR
ncbi:hypothetical protein CEE45_14535 [Candidatus Heimdallarchaeota archaeon B3_Heim]|nr:MAG: hypothetical protein CEE45_14535 [Candidatus Heimdallarchaeota archaeon B3_Heim]